MAKIFTPEIMVPSASIGWLLAIVTKLQALLCATANPFGLNYFLFLMLLASTKSDNDLRVGSFFQLSTVMIKQIVFLLNNVISTLQLDY